MPYAMTLSCDPAGIKGISERLIISHYENNYGGAVKRLNLIEEQLAQLEFDKAAGFLINGLKREQLIAMNSMILHELFFDGLGEQSEPRGTLHEALVRDFGSFERWRAEFAAMGKAKPPTKRLLAASSEQSKRPLVEPASERLACTSTFRPLRLFSKNAVASLHYRQ
jgi:hypothetical protein